MFKFFFLTMYKITMALDKLNINTTDKLVGPAASITGYKVMSIVGNWVFPRKHNNLSTTNFYFYNSKILHVMYVSSNFIHN